MKNSAFGRAALRLLKLGGIQCPQKDDPLIDCFKIATLGMLDLGPCHRPWIGCNWVPISPKAWALDGRHSAQNFVPHLQQTANYKLQIIDRKLH